MTTRPRFGLIGPGMIAQVFGESLTACGVGTVTMVCGRDAHRAAQFAARHNATATIWNNALVESPDVDAVYVATPHTAHVGGVSAALAAGKPVLCEKPIATDPELTAALHREAATRDLVLLEGWMYRHHPQISRMVALLQEGAIGRPRRMRSAFGFVAPADRHHRLLDPALGGGAIFDVGGYPMSLACLVAAAGQGRARPEGEDFEPRFEEAEGRRVVTGVDGEAHALLRFADDFEAEVSVSILQDFSRRTRIEGDKGALLLEDPFLPLEGRRGRTGRLTLIRDGKEEVEEIVAPLEVFAAEAKVLWELASAPPGSPRQPPPPLVAAHESIALGQLLAQWTRAFA